MQLSALSPAETDTSSCFAYDKHQRQQQQLRKFSADISPQSVHCLSYAASTPSLNTPQNEQLHQIRQEIDHLSERLSSLRDQVDCTYDFTLLSSTSSLLTIPPPPPPVHHALSSSALTSLALTTTAATSSSANMPPEIPPRTYRRKASNINNSGFLNLKKEPLDAGIDMSVEKDVSQEFTCTSEDNDRSEWQTVAKINFNLLRRSNCSIINEISELYANQTCWFELGPVTCFLNPYNDLVRKKNVDYLILSKILDQALESSNANIVMMGDCGSGRTYITERLATLLCERTTVYNSPLRGALEAALTIQRTFATGSFLNDINRTSTSLSYEFYVIRGSLDRIIVNRLKSLLPNLNSLPYLLDHFLEGMRKNEREKYFLESFETLKNPSSSAQIELNPVRLALKTLDIAFEDVMRIVAASFLLTRVQFSCVEGQIDVLKHTDLENAAILLGISSLSLYKIFTRKNIKNKFGTMEVSSSTDTASLDRDILVQNLLSECIMAIVRRINAVLQTETFSNAIDNDPIRNDSGISVSNKPFLARIILYDTTCFKSSSYDFDAFCVNFAAEKWRALYKEKIINNILPDDIAPSEQTDTNATLTDYTAPGHGLLCLLDNESSKRGGSEENFLKAVNINLQKLRRVTLNAESMIVRHYDEARPVAYNCKQFVVRNKNKLPDGMIELFSNANCSFPFASHLFMNRTDLQQLLPPTQSRTEQQNKQSAELQQPTVCGRLASEVDQVVKEAADGNCFIIHCLKPNVTMDYGKIDKFFLEEQLYASNLHLAVNFLQYGFPYRYSHGEFMNKYSFLHGNRIQTQNSDGLLPIITEILKCFLKLSESELNKDTVLWNLTSDAVLISFQGHRQLEMLRKQYGSSNCKKALLSRHRQQEVQLPKNRNYYVRGFRKQRLPQRRMLTENFLDATTGTCMHKGKVIKVIGFVEETNMLKVETREAVINVPEKCTRLTTAS